MSENTKKNHIFLKILIPIIGLLVVAGIVVIILVVSNSNKFETHDEYKLDFIKVSATCVMGALNTDISKEVDIQPTIGLPDGMKISEFLDEKFTKVDAYTVDGYPYYIYSWNGLSFKDKKVRFTCKLSTYQDTFSIFSLNADGRVLIDNTTGKKIYNKDGKEIDWF